MQGPHVVEAIGKFDDKNADIAGHRNNHFTYGLGGCCLTVLHLVQFGDAIHKRSNLVTEILTKSIQ